MSDGEKAKDVKDQADKLVRYINHYITRACKVSDALGSPGWKMLNDLLEKVDAL